MLPPRKGARSPPGSAFARRQVARSAPIVNPPAVEPEEDSSEAAVPVPEFDEPEEEVGDENPV